MKVKRFNEHKSVETLVVSAFPGCGKSHLFRNKGEKKIPTDVADFIDKLKPKDAQALMTGLLSKTDKTRICRDKNELCEIYEKSEELTRYIKRLNLS